MSMMTLRWIILLLLLPLASCNDTTTTQASKPPAKSPRVASLVPGATDLIVGMGAADHLVGISHHDLDRPETKGLPKLGDYHDFDWEKIARAKPELMIVFMAPDHLPAGVRERSASLGITLINVRTERLEDVFTELRRVGKAIKEEEKAAAAEARLRAQLDAVRKSVAGKPRPRILLLRDRDRESAVGADNFLNDLVELAGGENVITKTGWPVIDTERLVASRPDVILHLLPAAPSHVVSEANRSWDLMRKHDAVARARVQVLTQWYLLQPGMHIGDLAEEFARLFHAGPATRGTP